MLSSLPSINRTRNIIAKQHQRGNILEKLPNSVVNRSTKLSFKHLNFHKPVSIFTILLESNEEGQSNCKIANCLKSAPPLSFLLIISNNFVAEFPNFCPTQKCPKSLTVCLAYHMAMQLWLVQLLLLLLSAHFFDTLLPDFELLAKKARPPTIRPKLAPNMGFPPLPLCLLRTKSVRHIACGAFSYSIALVQCNAGI